MSTTARFAFAAIVGLFGGVAIATPLTFGNRTLEVPVPEGFMPASQSVPMLVQATSAYIPPNNRLVEMYVTPEDHALLQRGEPTGMKRQFQVQTLRAYEGRHVTDDEFEQFGDAITSELERLLPEANARVGDMLAQGNSALREQTGANVSAQLAPLEFVGFHRDEPWGKFFTMAANGSIEVDGRVEPFRAYNAGAIARFDGQIVYLYSMVDASLPNAQAVAEQSLSRWADQVRAANPEVAREEDEPSPSPIAGSMLAALVVAVAFALIRRVRNA